jgi:hypothetical protein
MSAQSRPTFSSIQRSHATTGYKGETSKTCPDSSAFQAPETPKLLDIEIETIKGSQRENIRLKQ